MTDLSNNSVLVPTYQHPFPLSLGQAALLVIDMQNGFCNPDGFCGNELGADLSPVRAIIPRIQSMISWARAHELLVVYTRESHVPDLSDVAPSKKLRYINAGYPIASPGKMGRFLIQGESGTCLIDELQPLNTELQIDKPAQSVFVATDLATILHQRNITHLLFAGVTTECCVLGSYRHASDLGFYCLLLEDCCAALNPGEHEAAIEVLLSENGAIGWVTSSAKLLELPL
jgi:nicotinamidase-related amidase